MLSSDEIRAKLKHYWPNLGGWFKCNRIWLKNQWYETPTLSQLNKALNACRINLPYTQNLNECDNFALFLHAKAKEYQVKNYPQSKYTWAFGDFVAKRRGLLGDTIHSACFCFSENGFYIVEPTTDGNKIKELRDGYKAIVINM